MITIFLPGPGYRLLITGLAVLFGLAACAPFSRIPPEKPSALTQARALEAEGRYLAAATAYTQLASTVQPPLRQQYQLQAAAALLLGNHLQEAQALLESMTPGTLEPSLSLRYRLLTARLALAQQDAGRALTLTEEIEALTPSVAQQITLHQVRAQAYTLEGDLLAAVRERIQLEPFLSSPQAWQENQRAIWYTLIVLPPDTLEIARQESLSNTFSGWLELARIFQRHQSMPAGLQQALNRWRQHYPEHPASLPLLQAEMSKFPLAPHQPATIALLLPTEGRFAAAAAAIRDGFFAAYYNNKNGDWAPIIRFYAVKTDLETGQSNVQSVYQQAREEGADFVVGPLTKQALARLADLGELPLPTLALNYLEQPHASVTGLYQLALSPEGEARSVAKRAWHDGYRNARVLVPDSKWGQRMRQAFTDHWEHLGGNLLEFQTYDPEKEDFSFPIQRLLNLDEGESRPQVLSGQPDRELLYELRQRREADFIFLAAFPGQARLLLPQLRFYWTKALPVYSSSHAYTGHPDPGRDQDLDGLILGDMPWVLNKAAQTDPGYQDLAAAYPENLERLKRLYALGFDAYRIIPHLNVMQQVQNMSFEGATGKLRMDSDGYLRRELNWARFEEGLPQPIGNQPPS